MFDSTEVGEKGTNTVIIYCALHILFVSAYFIVSKIKFQGVSDFRIISSKFVSNLNGNAS